MTLDEQINEEVVLYVGYCQQAAKHDEFEQQSREIAHKIFYHIQELRSTRKQTPLGIVSRFHRSV